MPETENVVGIDLGTTYSAIAQIDAAGNPQVIPNQDNERTTPSVVHIGGDDIIVGRIAKEMALAEPSNIVQFVKSDIGRRRKRFHVGDESWTSEEISAMILRKVIKDVQAATGGRSVRHAVITVPAFFNEQQRKSTEDAGHIAGIEVLSILNEPTAAALAYGFHELGRDQTILVYDLGGGTFDITIMRIEGNTIRMLATDGDVQLGGRDWDKRLIDHAAEVFMSIHGLDPREYPDSFQELIIGAEQAKVRLSKLPNTRIMVNCEGRREAVNVTRDEFEAQTQDLLAQTETTLTLTIEQAGLEFDQIDEILLVGGSTRMKAVHAMFEKLIGVEPRHILNPDECVAQGAAIHAVMLQLKRCENGTSIGPPDINDSCLDKFRLIEERLINAHTLGIQALNSSGLPIVAPVIPRASGVPCRQVKTFQTSRSGQDSVRIAVMEGEGSAPEACTQIGSCFVRDLPENLAQGTPIEVRFEYNQDSRLKVSATLPTIQQSADTEIRRTCGMTDDEIDQARKRIASLHIE